MPYFIYLIRHLSKGTPFDNNISLEITEQLGGEFMNIDAAKKKIGWGSVLFFLIICITLTGCGTSNDGSVEADTAPAAYDDVISDDETWAKAPNDMEMAEQPTVEPSLDEVINDVLNYVESEGMVIVNEEEIYEIIEVLYYAEGSDALNIFSILCNDGKIISEPIRLNLRNQVFTKVSAFSEGLAWVQYLDDNSQTITSVIDINGDVIYTPDCPVDYFSDFRDGYAFYLYMDKQESQNVSIDNVVSCIIDTNGNVTYTSVNDGIRVIIAYGDGHFLTLEHISTFDTEEWRFGSLDKEGNVLIDFDGYNNEIIDFSSDNLLYRYNKNEFPFYYAYLEEGMFDLISSLNYRVLYNVRDKRWVECHIDAAIRDADVLRGVFKDGYLISHRHDWFETNVNAINTNGEIIKLADVYEYSFVSSYSEGVVFCGNAYYDINGIVHISFPQYESRKFGGGTFNQGFAPLYVEGADGKDYFTIIDSEGNEQFSPVLGFPDDSLSEGYLVVQQDSGCALFDTQGRKVLETSYTIDVA